MQIKHALGAWGEQRARRHLEEQGWRILDTNWRLRDGELDIIALDGESLVFVEVKTRRGAAAGHPFEAVTAQKRMALRRLAGAWLAAQDEHYAQARIDVIGIIVPVRGRPRLEHIRDAA